MVISTFYGNELIESTNWGCMTGYSIFLALCDFARFVTSGLIDFDQK